MYEYIKGTITEIESNCIVLETENIGFLIYTASPYSYGIDKEYKVYIYEYVREDEHTLYGFSSSEEKKLFLKLIGVKGLGCKMALPMLASSPAGIIDAIERENILYLKKFPKIGEKVARQIILDLKGKLARTEEVVSPVETFENLTEALKGLGYKAPDIKKIIPSMDEKLPIENQIKEALKLLLK